MEQYREIVRARTLQLIEQVNRQYGISLKVKVSFRDMGRRYGLAGIKDGAYFITYSDEAVAQNHTSLVNIAVPHEVAHIVEHAVYGKWGHSKRWKAICLSLGGDGKRCAIFDGVTLTAKRRVTYYQYRTSSGREVWMSATKHNRMKKMKTGYRFVNTGELIDQFGFTGLTRIRE